MDLLAYGRYETYCRSVDCVVIEEQFVSFIC
jgi:hypothetical protein